MKFSSLFLTAVIALAFTACDSNDPGNGGQLDVQIASDIAADPVEFDDTGQPIGQPTNQFALFDLESGEIVLSHDDENRTDSVSTTWDIGFHGTDVIANTTEGSEGGILFVENTFEDVTQAPAGGYEAALPGGSGNGWYNYDQATNIVTPIPGRVIVVRTATGNYAKIRIVSYYKGAPAEPDQTSEFRYYTFEYVIQTDGTREFPME